jgi:demethylmenaquinone methyltransferase/2-methoxy-6-polyprenyl-1,4-benzoquinol methylase
MGNKYYQPGEERAGRVGDLFAGIARRYDLINDLQSFGLHRAWKRRLVELAAPQPGERALDVCCGTGDIAFALAGRGAKVVGLDFSEPMLEVARGRSKVQSPKFKVGSDSGGSVEFLQGDAQQLPFPENHFDIVTVGYGLRNLASWETGLNEMERVARPGGRLLVLDFGKPDNAVWRWLYFGYLGSLVPMFGKVFCRDSQAYAYILESLRDYPAQHGVASKLRALGCGDVRTVNLLGGVMSVSYGVKALKR